MSWLLHASKHAAKYVARFKMSINYWCVKRKLYDSSFIPADSVAFKQNAKCLRFGLNEACYRPRHALSLFLLPLQSSRGWPRYHHRQRLCHFHHPHHRLHILWCKWDIINANNDANEDRNALMISCVRKEKCWFINASTK